MTKFLPVALLGLSVTLAGCAGGGGLFCKRDHENPRVAALMKDSCAGDRGAAMQLGQWFEAREEFENAAHYYGVAATPNTGQTYIWVPPAGDVAGYVMPVNTGPSMPGNAEAQYRLAMMYRDGRGVERSDRKAQRYLKQAAEQGHADAAAVLAAGNRESD